jgi:hypothetical protein
VSTQHVFIPASPHAGDEIARLLGGTVLTTTNHAIEVELPDGVDMSGLKYSRPIEAPTFQPSVLVSALVSPPVPVTPIASMLNAVMYLGQGYDVLGQYAAPSSMKQQLFDWSRAPTIQGKQVGGKIVPDPVTVNTVDAVSYATYSGESAFELQRGLSASVQAGLNLPLFSASLGVNAITSTLNASGYAYNLVQLNYAVQQLAFDPLSSNARALLLPAVKQALLTQTPEVLFDTYGTHFLANILVGGRLDSYSATRVSLLQSTTTIAASATAKILALASGSAAGSSTQSIARFDSASVTNMVVNGGNPAILPKDHASYQSWLQTVQQSPVLMGYGTAGGLLPISALVDDPARRAQLDSAMARYLAERSAQHALLRDKVIDIAFAVGDTSRVSVPGYQKIPFDLNYGGGGKYIYLCVKKASVREIIANKYDVITDIKVIFNNDPTPPGYVKNPQDLNQGSGGDDIFACVKKEPYTRHAVAFSDIIADGQRQANFAPQWGYKRVPGDLDRNAGPYYIYFFTRKGA